MKEREKQPSAPAPEPQKRRAEFPLADRMKSLLERTMEHQPKPISLEGADDDTDTE